MMHMTLFEIFIQQEYLDFIPSESLTKILDLGAHYGYFSFWLTKRPQDEIHSIMVEPSKDANGPRKLTQYPKLKNRFQYLQAAVNPEHDNTKFLNAPSWEGPCLPHPLQMTIMK